MPLGVRVERAGSGEAGLRRSIANLNVGSLAEMQARPTILELLTVNRETCFDRLAEVLDATGTLYWEVGH